LKNKCLTDDLNFYFKTIGSKKPTKSMVKIKKKTIEIKADIKVDKEKNCRENINTKGNYMPYNTHKHTYKNSQQYSSKSNPTEFLKHSMQFPSGIFSQKFKVVLISENQPMSFTIVTLKS
jgi:hypothetical protein